HNDLLAALPPHHEMIRSFFFRERRIDGIPRPEERLGRRKYIRRRHGCVSGLQCFPTLIVHESLRLNFAFRVADLALQAVSKGSSTINVAPSPNSDTSSISPPKSRAKPLASANPRPAPPCRRVTDESPWRNSSNTMARAPGGI